MTVENRNPTLDELINMGIDYRQALIKTARPGRIESYDADSQTVNVQPMVQTAFVAEDNQEVTEVPAIIQKVPVMFPRGGGMRLTWPIEKGDFCLLVTCERSIDIYTDGDGGQPVDPIDVRMHDATDSVAFMGFYPFQKPIPEIESANLVIGEEEGGLQVHITKSGTMSIKVDGTDDEAVALGNALQMFWDVTVTPWMIAHTHPTGVGPSGPPIESGTFPSFDTSIISTVLKIKSG